jgi:putative hydrolase of the HAD superfamily
VRYYPASVLEDLDALFIDVGGTMLHARGGVGGVYSEVAVRLGLDASPADLDRQFSAIFARECMVARAAGRLAYGRTPEEATAFWRDLVREVFGPWCTSEAEIDELFTVLFAHFARPDAWALFADTEPLLAAARAIGLPVIAVSNWDARLPRVLDGVGLTSQLTAVVASYAVGAEKPDPEIFEAALALLPASADRRRILHVGDSIPEDVHGAEAVGLRAVWLDRSGAGEVLPGRIRSLAELHF